MTVTLDEIVKKVESELKELILRSNLGVVDIWMGSIGKVAPRYPMVHFLLTDEIIPEEEQVIQANKITWHLDYDVTCIFAGADDRSTITNLQTFTHSIYDAIYGQRTSNKRLNGTVQDILVRGIHHMTFESQNKTFVYGSVIKMIVKVIEIR